MINLAIRYNNLGVDILCGKDRQNASTEATSFPERLYSNSNVGRDQISGEAHSKRHKSMIYEEAERQARREEQMEAKTEQQINDALAHFQTALSLIVQDTERHYKANGLRYHPNDDDGFLQFEDESLGKKVLSDILPCETGIDFEGEDCNNQYIYWKAVKIGEDASTSFNGANVISGGYTCDLNDQQEFDDEAQFSNDFDQGNHEDICNHHQFDTNNPNDMFQNNLSLEEQEQHHHHHRHHHQQQQQQHHHQQQQQQQQQHDDHDHRCRQNWRRHPLSSPSMQRHMSLIGNDEMPSQNQPCNQNEDHIDNQRQRMSLETPHNPWRAKSEYESLAKSIYHSMICIYNIGLCYQQKGMAAKARQMKDASSCRDPHLNYKYFLDASVDHYTKSYELMTRFRLEDSAQLTFLMAIMNNLAATYGSLGQRANADVCNKYLVQSLILVICSSERDGHLGQEVLSRTDTKSILRKEEDRVTFELFLSNVMHLMLGDGPSGDHRYSRNTVAAAA